MNLKQIAIVAALASATTFVGVFPVEAARAVVTGNASVRSGPSTQYRIVGRLRTGQGQRYPLRAFPPLVPCPVAARSPAFVRMSR